jgi:hypothetical protein
VEEALDAAGDAELGEVGTAGTVVGRKGGTPKPLSPEAPWERSAMNGSCSCWRRLNIGFPFGKMGVLDRVFSAQSGGPAGAADSPAVTPG